MGHLKILLRLQLQMLITVSLAFSADLSSDLWRRQGGNFGEVDYENWTATGSNQIGQAGLQGDSFSLATVQSSVSSEQPQQQHKAGPLFITEPPGLIHYLNSSDLIVACAASGQPAPTISWWHNGAQLEPASLLDKRYIRYDNSLVISAFKPSQYEQDIHSGTYRCQASNPHGTIVSRDVVINAVIDQDYEASVQDQFVVAGNDAAFKCQVPAQARGLLQVIGWLEDGRRLPAAHLLTSGPSPLGAGSPPPKQPQSRALQLPDGRLYLSRVQLEERDRSFKCQLRHQLSGRTFLSPVGGRLFVTAEQSGTAARVTDGPRPITLARLGEQLLLACLAQGSPRPQVHWQWRKWRGQPSDWQELGANPNQSNDSSSQWRHQLLQESNLLLLKTPLTHQDQRTRFRCVANNTYGEHQAETELRLEWPSIEGVPQAGSAQSQSQSQRRLELEPKVEFISGAFSAAATTAANNQAQIQLNCTIRSSGWPLVALEWLHDGRPLFGLSLAGYSTPNMDRLESSTDQLLYQWPLNGSSLFDLHQDSQLELSATDWWSLSSSSSGGDLGDEEQEEVEEEQKQQAGQSYAVSLDKLQQPSHKSRMKQRLYPIASDQLLYQLVLERPSKRDKGAYQCRTRSGRNTQHQATGHLMLRDQAPQFVDHFGPGKLVAGNQQESVSLRCVASGTPLPEISWSLSGFPVPDSARFRVGDYVTRDALIVSFVNISSVKPEDGGPYECLASNEAGQLRHLGWLNVTGPPAVRPMPPVVAVAGRSLHLQCPAGGWPLEQVTWYQNSTRLPLNHRQKLSPNGSLLISDLNEVTDSGQYSCQARTGDQLASSQLQVNIKVPPLIEPFSFAKSLQRGQRYNIMCTVVRGDLPVAIRWFKDGRPLASALIPTPTQTPTLTQLEHLEVDTTASQQSIIQQRQWGQPEVKHLGPYSSALSFDPIEAQHRGLYTCEASNVAGRANQTASLVIHVPPEWRIEPKDLSVTVGRTAIIDCQADAQPAARIEWRLSQDFEREPPTEFKPIISSPYMRVFENGSLIIYNTQRTDAGHYLCQASNNVPPGLSRVIKLTVHVAAHFKSKIRSELIRRGQAARLRCEAIGEPPIEISWLRNKVPMYPSDEPRYSWQRTQLQDGLVSELTIPETDRTDSGLFTCLTQNAYGGDDTSIQLLVQGPPDPPHNVQVQESKARSAKIKWQPPDSGNSPLQRYVLMYGEVSSQQTTAPTNVTVAANETQLDLQPLQPLTEYQFQMLAVNAIGPSRFASPEPIRFRTRNEAPAGPPLFVKATPLSSHSIRLRWRAPERRTHYGAPTGFYVGYKQLQSRPFKNSSATTSEPYTFKTVALDMSSLATASNNSHLNEQECLLTGLRRGRKYAIIVQAVNEESTGPPSEPVLAETWRVDVPDTPTLRMVARTTRSIHLAWRPASSALSSSNHQLPKELASTSSAALMMRKSIIAHHIRQFTATTDTVSPPNAATKQQLSDTNQDQDQEDLELANQAQEPILGYILTRRQVSGQGPGEGQQPVEVRLPSDHLSQVVDNLQCGTKYQFQVAALNSVGSSALSDPLIVKTEGSAPVAPDKSSLLTIGNGTQPTLSPPTTVQINLAAWHNGACAMRSFELMFKPSRSSKWKSIGQVQANSVVDSTSQATNKQPGAGGSHQHQRSTASSAQQLTSPLALGPSASNGTILLEELSPQLNYDLKIVAANEAGTTEALYTFSTSGASLTRSDLDQQLQGHSDRPLGANLGFADLFNAQTQGSALFLWLLLLLALSTGLSVGCLLLARSRRHASSSNCSLSLSSASRSNQSSSNYYTDQQQQSQQQQRLQLTNGSKTLQHHHHLNSSTHLRLPRCPSLNGGAGSFGGGGGGNNQVNTKSLMAELDEEESPMLGGGQMQEIYGHQQLQQQLAMMEASQQQQQQKSNYSYLATNRRPTSPQPTEVTSILGTASDSTEMCLGASALTHAGGHQEPETAVQHPQEAQGYYVTSAMLAAAAAAAANTKPTLPLVAKSSTLPANCHQQILQQLLHQQQQAASEQQQQMMDSLVVANVSLATSSEHQTSANNCSMNDTYFQQRQQPQQLEQMTTLLEQQLQQQVYATVKRGCPRPPRLCDYTIYQCPTGAAAAGVAAPINQSEQLSTLLRCCPGEQQQQQAQNSSNELACYHQLAAAQEHQAQQICQQQHQQASDYQQLRPVN